MIPDGRIPLERPSKNFNRAAIYAGGAAVSVLLLFSRRPDALLDPQFWAEDGRNWYADAYNHGVLQPFVTPEAGYIQTFSRAAALISQAVPLEYAPLAFNLLALAVQVAVALFILSPRMETLIPDVRWRAAAAFLYLAMPHSWEVFANVTNSQWHLAFLTMLMVIAAAPKSISGKVIDTATASLSGVSGPFCFLLLPVMVLTYLIKRESRLIPMIAATAAGCGVQAYFLMTSVRAIQSDRGAGFEAFARIVGRHLAAGPLIGGSGFDRIADAGFWTGAIPYLAAACAIGFFAGVIWKGTTELRLLGIYSALIVAAALYSPAVTLQPGQWEAIASNNIALRYWFIPAMFFYLTLISLVGRERGKLRAAACILLLTVLAGAMLDWRQPQLKDMDFAAHAERFKQTPAGTAVKIPINPDWEMELIKR